MATILNDKALKKLIGKVIVDGDTDCLRPNSYILRLGKHGEFMNTGKSFELGEKKKGIRIPAGHSVGVTSFETIDFRRKVLHEIFPNADFHAIISPTTDL